MAVGCKGNDITVRVSLDGTGIRDFIHVMDLADGHVAALNLKNPGYEIFNLGTSKGYSVLYIINTMEDISNMKISYQFTGRRHGDIPVVYSNVEKAENRLKWSAKLTLKTCVKIPGIGKRKIQMVISNKKKIY